MKGFSNFLFALFVLAVVAIAGCGSDNSRQLQSLTVSPASTIAQSGQAQFTASGQFNTAPMSVSPASVSWWQSPPVIDPPGAMIGIALTNQPFTAQCFGFHGTINVTAVAPMKASGSGDSMPLSAFLDLVRNHSSMQDSGFVASTAQMTCP
ncbi:MAG: hypothetical protein LAO78_09165 [Acidobacteriia bacterium]|nr:hypothetical protein [Terriglobia bacterium]